MMTRRAGAHKRSAVSGIRLAALGLALACVLAACSSVPGETLASGGVRREVTHRVLALSNAAAPDCKSQRIADTEVVELHPDGKVAVERWTVEQCGTRAHYKVLFPAAGKATPVGVRAE
jgi:hypothetical protein